MSPVENIPHNDAYIRTQIRLRVLCWCACGNDLSTTDTALLSKVDIVVSCLNVFKIFLYYNNTCSIPSRYYLQLIGTDLSPAYIHN